MKLAVKTILLKNTGSHPLEDSFRFCLGEGRAAFAVADGVTLWPGIEYPADRDYPEKSGAQKAAEIFCLRFVERALASSNSDLRTYFSFANDAVKRLNQAAGRSKYQVRQLANNLFGCTAAFGVIRDSWLTCGSICDAGVMIMLKKQLKWIGSNHASRSYIPPDWQEYDEFTRMLWTRTFLRNSPTANFFLGYGLVTGEPAAWGYVIRNRLVSEKLTPGCAIYFFTDGLETLLKEKRIQEKLRRWGESGREKHWQDFEAGVARERETKGAGDMALIAVRVSGAS